MSTLTSRLFTQADPATFQRLENCANGVPNEVASHFAMGQQGEHIRRVQTALSTIADRLPELGIGAVTVNGSYDAAFANAVARYKQARRILNYANQVDNIVGRKTIASLDQDVATLQDGPRPPHLMPIDPRPRPTGSCLPVDQCPYSQSFTLQMLGGLTGGEVMEGGVYLFDMHDVANDLAARYVGTVAGLAVPGPIPVSPSIYGSPTAFSTPTPARVTDFFGFGIISVTMTPPFLLSASPVTLRYQGQSGPSQTMPFNLDTGPVNLPGAGIYGGLLHSTTTCNNVPGARRGGAG